MRIVEETPERLVLRETGSTLSTILALFTVIAAGEVLLSLAAGSILGVLGGLAVLALLGLALGRYPPIRRIVLDRAAGEARLGRGAPEGRRRIGLDEIASVEAQSASGDAMVARLALVLRDGTRLPLGGTRAEPDVVAEDAARIDRWLKGTAAAEESPAPA